jgi:hypothetical protein
VKAPPPVKEAAMPAHQGWAGHERRMDKDGEEEARDRIFSRASDTCGSERWETTVCPDVLIVSLSIFLAFRNDIESLEDALIKFLLV